MFYDVEYRGPNGSLGTHYAVEANSIIEVAKRSLVMLCYGTPFTPEDFTVLSANPSSNIPIKEDANAILD